MGRPVKSPQTRDPAAALAYLVRSLPHRIETARRRLNALEEEARRYGFTDLLNREHST